MSALRYNEVFTPNEQPAQSYVERQEHRLEQKLQDHLETKGIVISISGPSKSGKTVLVRKIVSEDDIIPISGASLRSVDDFWRSLFNWMHAPSEIIQSKSSSDSVKVGPRFLSASTSGDTTSTEKSAIDPFRLVVGEIGNSSFVIFIDDFHYIQKSAQPEIAKIIKALAENGVKVCTASVPHKNDDVVRANSELRGRLASLDVEPWSENELQLIARNGFSALKCRLAASLELQLASEALGPPQLMQAICMNLCRVCNLREALPDVADLSPSKDKIDDAFRDTSDFANFTTLTRKLHTGPKVHGRERKIFSFKDGSTGDVYRACLLAIAEVGPRRSFSYDEMLKAIGGICIGDAPVGSSVNSSLGHMAIICAEEASDSAVLEWDEDVLSVIDPYFLFFLRKSDQLQRLAG